MMHVEDWGGSWAPGVSACVGALLRIAQIGGKGNFQVQRTSE